MLPILLNDISGAFQWLNDVISENQEIFNGIVQGIGLLAFIPELG